MLRAMGNLLARTPWGKKRVARAKAEEEWLNAPLQPVSEQLLSITRTTVERELTSRESLNGRLASTITFAGALLAVALTLGQKASPSAAHHHTRHVLFTAGLVVAVVVLAVAIVTAIWGLRPEPRHHTSVKLLKHYGTAGIEDQEIQKDTFRFEVALAGQLGPGNTRRASHLLWAQRTTVLALMIAAAEAVIVLW